jgi:uncharacterized iron-regulated protein
MHASLQLRTVMRIRSPAALFASALLAACATPAPPLDAARLQAALASRPVVLLGEVHDNAAQHAARAQALRALVESGARPALAFEQFDRDRQAVLDRARSEPLPPGRARADHVIAQAGSPRGWNWTLYRPYVELALQYDLPIVAANLSRAEAMRVGREGFGAAFDAATIAALGLDRLPADFVRAHERVVDDGHCNALPAAAMPALARAQIARDAALAQAIAPHLARGLILLTGNGHARNDLGVPFFLPPAERARAVTIGLLEDAHASPAQARRYDVAFVTPTQSRPDPCAALRKAPATPPAATQ